MIRDVSAGCPYTTVNGQRLMEYCIDRKHTRLPSPDTKHIWDGGRFCVVQKQLGHSAELVNDCSK